MNYFVPLVPVFPPVLSKGGYFSPKSATSAKNPGMEYSSPIASLYQLSGIFSWPTVYLKLPDLPVIEKNDIRVSLVKLPCGNSSDLLDLEKVSVGQIWVRTSRNLHHSDRETEPRRRNQNTSKRAIEEVGVV